MKVDRESFLAATLALSAVLSTGCDLPAAIATRISPEKAENTPGAQPAANGAQAVGDDTVVDRGGDGFERGPATGPGRQLASPTTEAGGSQFVSPTKEAGGKQFNAPTNEGAKTMPAPTKEAGIPAPTKEAGIPAPTKEAGIPAPTKEAGYKAPPAPSKER